ncbi:MAG: PEGA domain-containing protein [Bradymonadales bacterium]|nr:PEGA domain-containing protein [Bradymonadales bacterium]
MSFRLNGIRYWVLLGLVLASLQTGVVQAQDEEEEGEEEELLPELEITLPRGLDRSRMIPPEPRATVLDRYQTNRMRPLRDSDQNTGVGLAPGFERPSEAERHGDRDERRESRLSGLRDGTRASRPTPTSRRTSSSGSTQVTQRSTSGSRSVATASGGTTQEGSTNMRRAPGAQRAPGSPAEYGRLIVITQFDRVSVTVEGQSYPYGSMDGVLLVAGEQYEVVLEPNTQGDPDRAATASQSRRVISVRLQPDETRVLMADLSTPSTGRSSRSTASTRRQSARRETEESRSEESTGYLGVSSSPRGIVYVDGNNTGQMTPARRIELEPGRHEVRIFYEAEDRFSETKNVLIRAGVNTNVFFRDRGPEEAEAE